MRTFFIFLLATYFTFSYRQISAQSEGYTIESFQDEYTELSEYESMSKIFGGDPLWEYEFQLDFQFPFYGTTYDKLIYLSEAWGSVTHEEDEALYLMDYFGGYSYPPLEDTSNIESDVRFGHVEVSNMQAFVIQYTKMRFFADLFRDSLNTYMNFQVWFFENGVMEVHFGEMHMDSTPIYAPGKGFYCFDSFQGIDTNEVCGPHVGISNPYNIDDGIAVSGSYDDYEVTSDIYDNLTVLPPAGWIIRFKPKSVGIFEPKPRDNQIVISPNPASSFIQVPVPGNKVTIADFSGKVVYEEVSIENQVSISSLPAGMYFVKMDAGNGPVVGRFIKL